MPGHLADGIEFSKHDVIITLFYDPEVGIAKGLCNNPRLPGFDSAIVTDAGEVGMSAIDPFSDEIATIEQFREFARSGFALSFTDRIRPEYSGRLEEAALAAAGILHSKQSTIRIAQLLVNEGAIGRGLFEQLTARQAVRVPAS